ncbi:threonine/serine exporter family protein [Halalkalibacterium halodurans]|uniref:BH0082 protein n=2 Tax=Halalkalibacterium halodurans TaxID=86665 RepID=Q9KGH9_HALH5|nr:threonine/serine exporter family protein [Halalkalibacterium halodurans]MDY7220585.1 threonine/serine exporter family protein [Halalkalibacterium halodurans]MDY7239824.1 threonine/serine exporter family protein [Halalkalibacterium halodurans]MED4125453.1 threonine/serine exporter family protein [Halalkalibacterium halodurans]MED4174720.1 threonine/serine exporter family protein [Halalkalibacterium halodurans]TPE68495.1 threonine/serine exporter [Halalkalibacterium halodurans]
MLVIELFFVFIATVAFGILFNVPKQVLWIGGFIGANSWLVFSLLPIYGASPIVATAAASLASAAISHLLAKYYKVPVTTFSIPGIIPLVPGSRAYFTMLAFVEGDYLLGLELGIETMLQAGAIAAGLVFALAVFSFRKGGIGQRYETGRS